MELTQAQIAWLNECTRGTWSLNKKGLVDIDGDFNCTDENLKDFKGVKFGVVRGDFYCSRNKLTSLVGAPQEVGGGFYCSNNKLTSLVGAPQEVRGRFDCSYNKLISLVGAPQKVKWGFYCDNNKLTSLEGAPQEVGWGFYCNNNKLTSLVGAPQEVGGWFSCSYNQLTSLVGAPRVVRRYFSCHDNPITAATLELIHETMVERDVPYIIALGLLRIRINKEEFDKLSSGYNEGSLNAASIMSRFV